MDLHGFTISCCHVDTAKAMCQGNEPLMAEIEESEEKFGLHVTLGGFPMKAWLKKEGNDTVLAFSNGGRWAKL